MADTKKTLARARKIVESLDSDSRTFYVRAIRGAISGKTSVKFVDRYYPTYDRPDWTYHFEVGIEEADALVDAGLAHYYGSREDAWRHLSETKPVEKAPAPIPAPAPATIVRAYVVVQDFDVEGHSPPVDGLAFTTLADAERLASRTKYGEVLELEVVDSSRAIEILKRKIIDEKRARR